MAEQKSGADQSQQETGGVNLFKKGWYTEYDPQKLEWKDACFSIEMEEVLYHKRSLYQDVLVFRSKTFGHVLVLDGIIQCTEKDEFVYQEMISHLPLFAHKCPESVLVIGGGDGGVLREVAKHPSVKEIHLCEIDEDVITVSKKFLPSMAVGFDDPRVHLHIEDGCEYMKRNKNRFDVIITDSSDPFGPAEVLFQKPYYESIKAALKPKGILCSQGECMWADEHLIKNMFSFCHSLFPAAKYATCSIPTYPGGQIGFIVCTVDEDNPLDMPARTLTSSQVTDMNLKYYNSDIHRAAFVLPVFFQKYVQPSKN
jgi:spermidine synthase